MAFVELDDVVKEYAPTGRGREAVRAVDGVTFSVETGEILGIIGYSGAGKSTLVRLINALELATSGSIRVGGQEVVGRREGDLRRLRRDIGMIFQQFNLFHSRTVARNVEFPLEVAGVPSSEREGRVAKALDFVGLLDRAHDHPEQLSGGQKQRVGIARALAMNPKLILADEPTSALDPETTSEVLAVLKKVNQELGITVVLITHEMAVVKALADRVVVLEKGRKVESGTVFEVFSDPQSRAAQRFVSTVVNTVPQGEELAQLRERHHGRLVTLSLAEGSQDQARIFGALARHHVGFEIVSGGIDTVDGCTFGVLTLELIGTGAAVQRAVDELEELTHLVEVS